MEFLEVHKLYYEKGKSKILKDIDVEFKEGRFYSIVGPNGSGKTTLLKNIIKALEPTFGEVLLEGKNIKNLDAKILASKLSYVPQNTYMELDFTCLDVVMMGRSYRLKAFQKESEGDREVVYKAMKRLDVFHLKDKFITEISGGERQRVILARAIAKDGNCIILDEPISHLDIKHQISVLEELKKLKEEGKTIITVLHDLNFTLNYSEEVILMKNGSVYEKGKVNDVITSENIQAVYGVNSEIIHLNNRKQIIFNIGL